MRPIEQWIWLPKALYPQYQTSAYNLEFAHFHGEHQFARVALSRDYDLKRPIREVHLRFSGDTFFMLSCNETFLASGPASAGGDFLKIDGPIDYRLHPLSNYYATEMTLTADSFPGLAEGRLHFRAQVRMTPARLFDQSKGHGGFFLTAMVLFEDGTEDILLTNETWQIQRLTAYLGDGKYDNSHTEEEPVFAERIDNIWNCETSEIPPCVEEVVSRTDWIIPAGTEQTVEIPFDKIYAGYLAANVSFANVSEGNKLSVEVICRELEDDDIREEYVFVKDASYRGMEMLSVGNLLVHMKNDGPEEAKLHLEYIISYYPVYVSAETKTSDEDLNLVVDVCKHTLKQCRQTIHLDGPRHCEPLACTGDYYIESLMTAFTFGDQTLSAFDVRRTAELLRNRHGRIFHTTYSLIWVQMLWDVYRLTGERKLLTDCEDALVWLFKRFDTYMGENGLMETPPDFMFIDWLIPDGINLHHPPKALGQTCLNLFYYGALKTAAKIYSELGKEAMAQKQLCKMNTLHAAIYEHLYDHEKELFFEGLNTPTPEALLSNYMPQNVEKRYYRKHANILAAYFGFLEKEECQRLLHKIIPDNSLGHVQPYFCHFLLEAIYRNDLRDTYTLSVLEQWKAPVKECSKGIVEGFYKPVETYAFDHSHAWAGTPAYALPLALTGISVVEPGFKRIRLNPSLLGLKEAYVQIPTPMGMIEVMMKEGEETQVTVPDGIILEK